VTQEREPQRRAAEASATTTTEISTVFCSMLGDVTISSLKKKILQINFCKERRQGKRKAPRYVVSHNGVTGARYRAATTGAKWGEETL